jgi:hypothetical protein
MVERAAPTVRWVSVEGPVTRMIPGTDELLREITVRYLPPEKVPAYQVLLGLMTDLGFGVSLAGPACRIAYGGPAPAECRMCPIRPLRLVRQRLLLR